MPETIGGVLTAIVTPFTAAGSLNVPALKVQVSRWLEAGNATFCGGASSEFFVLNEQKELSVTQTCVDEAVGRALVVMYIGEISTRETIHLDRQIEKPSVDAVSVIAPCLILLKQEELTTHYSAVADALSIPMFLYNILARTDNAIQPETAYVLASYPNITRTKNGAGSDESLKGSLDAVHDIDGFDVLNGPDSLIHRGFVEGCSTCISGLASIAPWEINAIWSRSHAGDTEGPYEAQEGVTGLRTDLYKVTFSPTAVKKALQPMGHDVGDGRYAVNFTPEQINEVQQIIRHYDIN